VDSIALLNKQIELAHLMLEGTMSDVTPEQAHWYPGDRAASIGGNYAHLLLVEDRYINGLRGALPLAESAFADRMGVSEPLPFGNPWDEWARRVKMDLPAVRAYAQAVYKNTSEYVGSLEPDDLTGERDLTSIGGGKQGIGWVLSVTIIAHINMHHGEISFLKGLQGGRGYPI